MKNCGISVVITIVVILALLCGCGSKSINLPETEGWKIQRNNTSSDYVEESSIDLQQKSEDEQDISEDIYSEAMEKWNKLGGNFDFKSIESINTGTLVKIYSSYMMQAGSLDFGTPDIWMDLMGFDRFVKDYFNLDPEQFHQNYPGASDNFDSKKGFLFYMHTSILPDDAKYKMENYGGNGDETYYFEELTIFELPKELLPEGESNTIKRTTIVTFEYVEGKIYFLKATYQQDGEML